ncbi:CDP-alcohol phosphatidyltransferase family protein [Nonlabens ponticola]|uniref:CDP-alcohol phosphatidyltransferase family protein n=1 Tax=Nonlabens ponticola TaxID=2496866 RepID=A0A3S9MYQ4_9FLAO|nr:CDP-alcohol phosphatidyltransferase family protein [Nonlabens ponticola]AZQ44287.1 CDP-alcohol phosphatidyltransferase family protein [Nonlabens ponticola]
MSKLPAQYRFIDLSDYGRPGGRWIARMLQDTRFTPIHVTVLFIISGLFAIGCILHGDYVLAALFLILKSVIDAADGELARLKKTPSYVGRYFDSIADLILNLLFLLAFMQITGSTIIWTLVAFIGLQLQGTLYHYYYVILRNNVNGDITSRISEEVQPIALPGEKQSMVNLCHSIYNVLYGPFDQFIHWLDPEAVHTKSFPKWFMTSLSIYGLGFQLLLMALLLVTGWQQAIIPGILGMTLFIFVFIAIRRLFIK